MTGQKKQKSVNNIIKQARYFIRKDKQIAIRCTEDMYNKIKYLADRENISMSSYCNYIMSKHLEHFEKIGNLGGYFKRKK